MKWIKQGAIFAPKREFDWMATHASVPVPEHVSDRVLRVYFGTRDLNGRSHIGYVNLDSDNPRNILGISQKPLLPLGSRGTFDDSGIMPSSLVRHKGKKYLYYIGWNQEVTVPYRLAIGLAVSDIESEAFNKISDGPICDRSIDEPYFNTAPCVLVEDSLWRMWYVSCTAWSSVEGRAEPHYHVKYAESLDGIVWRRSGRICIGYDKFTKAIGRPCVFKDRGLYKMLYSFRSDSKYRIDPAQSYRLGYAESEDGLAWTRKDSEVGIERSRGGWDSQMMEYCSTYEHRGRRYLIYNGNDFGKSGFGYAELEE